MKPLLVLPAYSRNEPGWRTAQMVLDAEKRMSELDIVWDNSSFLTFNFNVLWCHCLNDPSYSHFIMLHADVAPKEDNWLERIIQVTDEAGADVMSAVIPLKGEEGLTSTALDRGENFGDFRRLTMTETMSLPASFSKGKVADLFGWERSESILLTNTGLMCVNMRHRDKLSRMAFDTRNWIRRSADGKFFAISEPEDWNWARQAQEHGLQVWATRAVPVTHIGEADYDSDKAWGTIEHDSGDQQGVSYAKEK